MSYYTSLYVVWLFYGHVYHPIYNAQKAKILENKKCLKITLHNGPYAMDKKIYILVTNCLQQTLFIS
jgi:hypothetical protein